MEGDGSAILDPRTSPLESEVRMTTLRVDDEEYRVQFRHQSKLVGRGKKGQVCRKKPSLHKAPMDVLTTCVVSAKTGIAIGHAMCMPGDNFNKALARDRSFARAIGDCALFSSIRDALTAEYDRVKPKTSPIAERLTFRERAGIANFLAEMAGRWPLGSSKYSASEAFAAIMAAADVVRHMGTEPSKDAISPEARQTHILAGESVRTLRATEVGRAALNRERRAAG